MQTPVVSEIEKYVQADGRLTIDGLILIQLILSMLKDHEDRLVTGGL